MQWDFGGPWRLCKSEEDFSGPSTTILLNDFVQSAEKIAECKF